MLVLTRQPGERLVIADAIVVTVVEVAKGKVRLGIEAPPEVRVLRQELLKRLSGLPPDAVRAGLGRVKKRLRKPIA